MSRFFRSAGDSDSDSSSSEEEELLSDSGDEAPKPKPAVGAKPMSRFLRKEGDDDSDSDSDDSDESTDESDAPKPQKKRRNLLVGDKDSDDSDDSDDAPKQVKSAREKRLEEIEATTKNMDNSLKINDWVNISNEFEKLVRLVQRETTAAERIPLVFFKFVAGLDDSVATAIAQEKEAKKKMNPNNARALNQMKQRVKKTIKEYENDFKRLKEDREGLEREYAEIAAREAAATQPKKVTIRQEEGEGGEEEGKDFTTVAKGGKGLVFAPETVFKNLQIVNEARGKKNTDRNEQLRILEQVLQVTNTTYQRIRVLLALISSRFDYTASASSHLPVDLWTASQREVDKLIAILSAEQSYLVQEVNQDYDELVERTPESEEGGVVRIRGSMISYIDRLDDEFTKSLQNIDPHGTEYIDRLKDEKGLYQTICAAQALFEKLGWTEPLARTVMRRVEHIYSKPDAVIQALETNVAAGTAPKTTLASAGSPTQLVHSLCVFLYKNGDSLLRTRAMLCHIYHYALQNKFHTARDMLLMSHLQESIHNADVGTQILYNRAIVQLGLSAFRTGLIREAQAILLEIHSTQRVKELLAQGVQHTQRYTQLTPEQERAERQRQLPFHVHINTELLEAAFLVSCMLVEIPLLASIDSDELKRKAISKPYRRLLDFADRQIFSGPPETTRDHIMQASKALQDGEWEKCRNLIQSIKIWSLMPEEKAVKEMLARRIQEEGLRTYLFTYSAHYTTVSLDMLARTFSLPVRAVTSIVSKMIWNEELAASLEHATQVVVFHRVELSRSQQLALTLADKLGNIVDQNEKYLDQKLGGGGAAGGWGERGGERGEARGGEGGGERNRRGGGAARGGRGSGRGGRGGARFVQGPLGPASARPRPQQ